MEEKLWFNEDDDCVFGYKNQFESETDFLKKADELHIELTGYSCNYDDVKTDVFLISDEPLEGEYCYRLKDSKIQIETLYFARCESLEYAD